MELVKVDLEKLPEDMREAFKKIEKPLDNRDQLNKSFAETSAKAAKEWAVEEFDEEGS